MQRLQAEEHVRPNVIGRADLGVGLFQLCVSVAQDRESPFANGGRAFMTTPQTSGSHAFWWLVFVTVAVALVVALAFALGQADVGSAALVRLAVVCLIASLPATFFGIALRTLASARAAVLLANLIYQPPAHSGGLWVPPMVLPSVVNAVFRWVPTRAIGELGWAAIAGARWDTGCPAVLLCRKLFAVVAVVVAHARRRRFA